MKTSQIKPTQSSTVIIGIKNYYLGLSKGQKQIADLYLKAEKFDELVLAGINDVAEMAGVSLPSVTRFVKLLGYTNYKEFQISLAQSYGIGKRVFQEDQVYGMVSRNDNIETICEKIFYSNIQGLHDTLALINYKHMILAANKIMKAGKIHFCGFGWSNKVAIVAGARFERIGFNTCYHDDPYSIAKHVAIASADEVFFGISISGHTKPIYEGLEIAKKKGLTIISLTGQPKSPIDRLADISMYIVSEQSRNKVDYYSKDPSIGMIMSIILIDALYMYVYMKTYDKASNNLELSMEALDRFSKL